MMNYSTAHDPSIATEIGKYHLVAELARGGMGNVYLAVMQGPGGFSKLLVVKELRPELSEDDSYVAMFLDEARLAARLIHPNIVQTNEVGSDGTRHYMVMEFLDGRSLHRIIKRLGPRLPVGAQIRVIAEALLGLHYAHEVREFDGTALEIVHRDVSPLNVFVTFAGQAKVVDFGIAKALDSSLETKLGVLKGRIAYMSPEQAKGGKVDRRADVYSAGVMLWEAAAGRRLWPGKSEVEILAHLLREGPPPLRAVCPDAPAELDLICARAMAWDRDDRYPTAADFAHDLEMHLSTRDDSMTMREVGALVAQAFTEERRKMNAIIDETLGRVRSGPRSGAMPILPGQLGGAPSSAQIEAAQASRRVFTPSGSFPLTGVPSSSLGSLSRSAPVATSTLNSARVPAGRWSWATTGSAQAWAATGMVLMAGVLVAASVRSARPQPRPVIAAVAAPVPASVAPAAPVAPPIAHEEPEFVNLMVRVSPPSAQIMIDGASVVSNPFHARYPKGSQVHHISASLDGYEPKLEDIAFSNDVSIDISLNRRPSVAPQWSTVAAPPAALSRRSSGPQPTGLAGPSLAVGGAPRPEVGGETQREAQPTIGHAPLRPISTSNPYGNP